MPIASLRFQNATTATAARPRAERLPRTRALGGVLRVALRHTTVEATLGGLSRNAALRRLIGIEHESEVPKPWNVSRFFDVLGHQRHLPELRRVFDVMIRRLGLAVVDLGRDTAGDATALASSAPC